MDDNMCSCSYIAVMIFNRGKGGKGRITMGTVVCR